MRNALATLLLLVVSLHAGTLWAEIDAGVVADASTPTPASVRAQTLERLRSESTTLNAAAESLATLPPGDFSSELVKKFHDVNLDSPEECGRLAERISAALPAKEQLAADRAAMYEQLRRSYRRPPKPDSEDAARLALLETEAELANAHVRLDRALASYIEATQPARREAEERARAERESAARALEQQLAEAQRAEQEALEEAERALTAAEQELGRSRATLENTHQRQIDLEQRVIAGRKELQELREAHALMRRRLTEALQSSAQTNPQVAQDVFVEVTTAIDASESKVLGMLVRQLLRSVPTIPEPPETLPAGVLELPAEFRERVDSLRKLRGHLETNAARLLSESHHLRTEQARHWLEHTTALADIREQSLALLRDPYRSVVFGLTSESLVEVQKEGAFLATQLLGYLDRRWSQLHSLSGAMATLQNIVKLAVGSIELIVFIALIAWSMRRWKPWMRGTVSAMGRYIHLGGWPLIIARVADALQSCGPPLILAAAAAIVYHFLGGSTSPIEIQLGYILIFWIALFRGQLRFFVGFAENLAAKREQAARDRREETAMAADHDNAGTDGGDSNATADENGGQNQPSSNGEETGPGREYHRRASRQFHRTWRLLTSYAATYVIGLKLFEYGLGKGVAAHHFELLAHLAFVPIVLLIVHWWRNIIVSTYAQRAGAGTAFGSFVIRHGGKPYGAAIALIATPVLLVTRIARLVREHVANLNATRRLLAFLFRRQVERHAEKTGQTPTKTTDLPPNLIALFPSESLAADKAPLRSPAVDEIESRYNAWRTSPVDGSVALIGGSGMGKTTILNFLLTELEADATLIPIDSKLHRANALWQLFGEELGLPEEGRNEDAVIAAVRDQYHNHVICLDDAHNLFIRRVGGFEAWRALTRVVNATSSDIFWVIALNDVSWGYLLALEGGVSPFREEVPIPGLSEDRLRKLMLSRMRMGRFRTSFSDLLISDYDGMRRSTQIIRTSRGYFSMLWDYSRGNPRIANHYWLRSLVIDGDTARVRLFSTPPIAELEALRDEAAFTLAAIVEHENVNATELATVCNLAKDRARFLLQLCFDKGMLVSPTPGRFEVSTHWQVAIHRFLRRKNLLYA